MNNPSRSNPFIETNAEKFTTTDIYIDSSKGCQPLPPYPNINGGFTCVLANPIILDISHRYVIALIKYSFDISAYTTVYTGFGIFTDLIEYQYVNNQMGQLLYGVYDILGVVSGTTIVNNPPAQGEIINPSWKFINPTQKVIKEISFWILDEYSNPLITLPDTTEPTYIHLPTKLEIHIKKVNTNVYANSQF